MKAFLDTSSLIKLYHTEEGSERLFEELSEDVEEIYLSGIAKIEFLSTIWKKIRHKEISQKVGSAVIAYFEADNSKYQWITIDADIIDSAAELIKKHGNDGLRTLDSLQLASAITLRDEDCVFFTSDKVLQRLFDKENLNE